MCLRVIGVIAIAFVGIWRAEAVLAQQQPGGQGGVLIDAEGVLKSTRPLKSSGRKTSKSAKASQPERRIVSLKRLEQACLAANVPVDQLPAELQTFGGLTLIDEVVLSVDDQDVYLVGPGESPGSEAGTHWFGADTGQPLIRMEDWLVVLRAVSVGTRQISCSIDPDSDRLKRYNEHIQATASQVRLATAGRWYAQLAQILGRQNVSIEGVPLDSRVAVLLAEADFSMKRIALGLDPSGVREIKSQLALAGRDKGATMQRWWFAPLYEPVEVNPERTRFRLAGQRVQLLAQEELVAADGERYDAATTRRSTQTFAKAFTEHFTEIAAARPVFSEMRSQFDLAVVATIIIRERFPERCGWEMESWLSEEVLKTPTHAEPRFVESASTTRRVNSTAVVGLVGGVTMSPAEVLREEQPLVKEEKLPIRDGDEHQFVWTIREQR